MTKIIAVTACPSGVAHTYMAAEALESAAKAKGWEVKVETQGSIGKTIVRVNISDAVKRADAIMSKIEAHLAQTA